ncbi:hypothetical protein [Nocardioides convexus]|uniref:hypothetical protein n=1 Tax=Nocardioides convexus TaxID=2712224 RepID=UPI00241842ED|nr:hypothetical protein [Nocardioides convexus]
MLTSTERLGRTRLRVSPGAGSGRCRVRTATTQSDATASVVRPMLVAHDRDRARVSLVPEGALLLAGDAVEVDVSVDAGMSLDLVEPGGTVAFDMRGATARWDVRIETRHGCPAHLGRPSVRGLGGRGRHPVAPRALRRRRPAPAARGAGARPFRGGAGPPAPDHHGHRRREPAGAGGGPSARPGLDRAAARRAPGAVVGAGAGCRACRTTTTPTASTSPRPAPSCGAAWATTRTRPSLASVWRQVTGER